MAYTTIDNPELYFQVKAYTGNGTAIGSGGLAVTLDGDEDMQPDFVWLKNRSTADRSNQVYDVLRGVTKGLKTNSSDEENTSSERLTAFGSDGFTVGDNVDVNTSGDNYVAWCWKESATAGFDIVSFTGNDTARTISHNLSAVPKMMIFKNTGSSSSEWPVYHGANTSAPATDRLFLSGTHATGDNSTFFNDTAPTSSVFSVGDSSDVNEASEITISYLFAEKQGFSKFGSYTGNGDADGTFIYTGFRPAFVMVKESSTTNSWRILDNKRSPINVANLALKADMSSAEFTADHETDFLSNGFKARTSDSNINRSSGTYIYMAFAEAPFVNSNGVPCNAR